MLPGNLSSSYDEYKKNTHTFVTWLYATAIACNYIDPSTVKERKAQNGKPLPVIELIKQANTIATSAISKKVKVPIPIRRSLRDAIDARKRCSAWFHDNLPDGELAAEVSRSNCKHKFFTTILERTLDILKPHFEIVKPRPAAVVEENECDLTNEINHGLESLELEEVDDQAYAGLPSGPTASNIPRQELEVDQDVEIPFIVYCFFQDLNTTRFYINQAWEDVGQEKLHRAAAAVFTHVCMERIHKAEQKIIGSDPDRFDKAPFISILASIRRQTGDGGSTINTMGSEKLQENTTLDKEEASRAHDDSHKDETSQQDNKSTDSEPLTPIFGTFFFVETFLILQKVTRLRNVSSGSFSVPKLKYCSGQDSKFFKNHFDNDKLLSQILLDLEIKNLLEDPSEEREKSRNASPTQGTIEYPDPVADNMTSCLQDLLRTGRITVSAVFQARILLDILDILPSGSGGRDGPYNNLMQAAAICSESLILPWNLKEITIKEAEGKDLNTMPEKELRKLVFDPSWHTTQKLHRTIAGNLGANLFVTMKQAIVDAPPEKSNSKSPEDNMPRPDRETEDAQITANPDPTFLHKCRPIYCCLEELRLKLESHQLGIELANKSACVLAVAHLYNAMKKFGLLTDNWDLLDSCIEIHMSDIFNGSLPVSWDQICNRWSLRIGTPASAFAKDGRKSTPSISQMEKATKSLLKVPDTLRHLSEYITEGAGSEKLLHFILRQRKNNRKTVVDEDPLSKLKDSIQSIMKILDVNIIHLFRHCYNLLKFIRDVCKLEVETVKVGNKGQYQFSESIFTANTIFTAIRQSRYSHSRSEKNDKLIASTAFVIQEFVQKWSKLEVPAPLTPLQPKRANTETV